MQGGFKQSPLRVNSGLGELVGWNDEGFWVCVIVFADKAVDGGLKVDDGLEEPYLSLRRVSLAKKPSTALSHEHEVGVKWKVQRGWRASQARTLSFLCAA